LLGEYRKCLLKLRSVLQLGKAAAQGVFVEPLAAADIWGMKKN
jgi:hypothetical protein